MMLYLALWERKRRNRSTKINRKVNQKSTKNQCKIHRKSTTNQPKMDQKSLLEGSREALGGSWRPRSKKCELLEPHEAILGPSWRWDRRLGPSWAVLGPSWAVLKSMSKSIKKSMPFKIGFWNDFGGFLKEKWKHVGTKKRDQLRKMILLDLYVFPRRESFFS